MSVRKGRVRADGSTPWIVDYFDAAGKRHQDAYPTKKAADAAHDQTKVDLRKGTHVPASTSLTIEQGAALWLEDANARGLERASIENSERHVRLHIVPFIGRAKMSTFHVPNVREFQKTLRAEGRSADLVRKVLVSLSGIFAECQDNGKVAHNPVRDMSRVRGKKDREAARHKRVLEVGRDIPSLEEIKALEAVLATPEHAVAAPMILTQILAGLRISEVRGLAWETVDFEKSEIRIRQRADRYCKIGPVKSKASRRTIPMGPKLAGVLKAWRLRYPRPIIDHVPYQHAGEAMRAAYDPSHLVFPNGVGNVEARGNLVTRFFSPAYIAAGLTATGADGEPEAKYSTHALRHFYASWCINAKADGGLELSPKVVQTRLGHATVAMTMDTYGHLFPRGDDGGAMARGEEALFG